MKRILTLFTILLFMSGCTRPPPPPVTNSSLCEKCTSLGTANSPKKALVIGNSQYEHQALNNPQNDAEDMANLLANEMGFDVTLAHNLNYHDMDKLLKTFRQHVATAPGKADEKVGLFYFSGHGARSNRDENYLIPIDNSKIKRDYDLRKKAFQVKNEIVEPLETANPGVNIIVADACRDNPYQNSQKSGKRGLKPIPPPSATQQKLGAVIAFAASEGEVADDGKQKNGLYTKHLLAKMQELKHDSIERVFKKVVQPVVDESNGEQNPWHASSLAKTYCIGGCR